MVSVVAQPKFEEHAVGQVFVRITVTNAFDSEALLEGRIEPAAVRKIEFPNILVDTGATHLALPENVVESLGLRQGRAVRVSTATGPIQRHVYHGAMVEIDGRSGIFTCLSLPNDTPPLLGVVPLEDLGFEPDLRNRRLRKLPDDGPTTYITAL